MTTLPIFQVDAFTNHLFKGNPAAVVPLDSWLDEALMQSIAAENNLAETAFFVPEGNGYHLRWFTPTCEVDLCGHATLATAHVLYTCLDYLEDQIRFQSRSGELIVVRNESGYTLDFPAKLCGPAEISEDLVRGLGARPQEVHLGMYMLAIFERAEEVMALKPDFRILNELEGLAVVCTAPGDDVDFVSRFFGPAVGVDEDPVTGSAHCMLTPFWADRLGKETLLARQVSARGGEVLCQRLGDRVHLTGAAKLYLKGEIYI
jgi:PhzF family phenazine biosynthesis protein